MRTREERAPSGVPSRARAALLCVAGLALGLPAVPGVAVAAVEPDSYRVITYNVDMPGDLGGYESRYGTRNVDRVDEIATRIRNGDADGAYDVVVLTEVEDVDTRDRFRQQLGADFPHSVPDLGDEDLMLFSRFPFTGVPAGGSECQAFNAANHCTLAFHEYAAGDGGIGFVRINNPHADEANDIYFTRLQEGEDRGAFDARAAQVAEAVAFVQHWSGNATGPMDVILAGDLNIKANTPEHSTLVLGQGGFAGVGLADTWGVHNPPSDRGFTVDSELNAVAGAAGATVRERTDHVLFRHSPDIRSCVQHATLERHFTGTFHDVEPKPIGTTSIVDLSDHFPVAVGIGKSQPQCSPATPQSTERAMLNPADDKWHERAITRLGGFQWYRYDTPGTYTFTVKVKTQQNMLLDVYETSDMSTPLEPVSGDGVLVPPSCDLKGCAESTPVVVDATGPFFVRVRMQDPLDTGEYSFRGRLHRGGSFADAIYLDPFEQVFQDQMAAATNPLPVVHYRVTQHALDSGLPQTLAFGTTGHDKPLRIQVYDAPGKQFPEHLVSAITSAPNTLTVPAQGSPVPADERDLFFTVDQGCDLQCPVAPITYEVRWTTSLRHLDVRRLVVVDQNDDPEPTDFDEVTCRFWTDFVDSPEMGFGSLAEGDSRYFDAPLRDIAFDDQVQFECLELDNEETTHDTTHVRKVLAEEIPGGGTFKVNRDFTVYNDMGNDPNDTNGIYRIHFRGHG
jgi:hypothetical protein